MKIKQNRAPCEYQFWLAYKTPKVKNNQDLVLPVCYISLFIFKYETIL